MTRYPLSWPVGWKRTESVKRTRARFGKRSYSTGHLGEVSIEEGTRRVLSALRVLGVRDGDAIISTNLVLRLDGYPRSDQRAPADPGVCVYWQRVDDAQHQCMAIDMYDRVADNLAAIAATLEALRAIERHGGAAILDRAFSGFTALPGPDQTTGRSWREVLGLDKTTPVNADLIRTRFRFLAAKAHPDKPGGSTEAFQELEAARRQALESIGVAA